MKILKKITAISLALLVCLLTLPVISLASPNDKQLEILFTHDTHSHLLPEKEYRNGQIVESGGYARLKTALDQKREKYPNALSVDAGDFTAGSLFQTIYTTDAAELRLLGELGIEATTYGNHEFDFTEEGFAQMLESAAKSGDILPQFIMSNLILPRDQEGNLTPAAQKLQSAFDIYGAKKYTVIQKGDTKVAIFGLMGKDAFHDMQTSDLKFEDNVTAAKNIIEEIKSKENVDMIMCLSHSGTNEDHGKSEDEILAREVPDIDVIISGHTHTLLESPIVVGDTYIVSCGAYCSHLGELNLTQKSDGRWSQNFYSLAPIDSSLKDDQKTADKINSFKASIQSNYLDKFNLNFDDILAYSPYNYPAISEISKAHTEQPLLNIISDSYRYAVKKYGGGDIDISVVPLGTTRASITNGNIKTSDIFNICPLGIGKDGTQGYPLVKLYIKGSELRDACEIDASVSQLKNDASLYFSGLSYTYNPNRMFLDKVTDVKIMKADGTLEEVDNNKLYSCVTGWYAAKMLSSVKSLSLGALSVTPRDETGAEITDTEYTNQIVHNGDTELKEWFAVADYIQSFDKINLVPTIPEYYSKLSGREILNNSNSIIDIVKNPHTITIFAGIAIVVILIIITLIILLIFKITKVVRRKLTKN